MPLGTCRDCGLQVSTAAASCPRCGRVFAGAPQQVGAVWNPTSKRFVVVVVLIGIAFISFGRACATGGPPPTAAEIEATKRQNEDSREIAETQYALTQTLRDPSSAEFGTTVVVRKAGSMAVCGSVNAKNGFGGFTGPVRFLARNRTSLVETPANARAFASAWNRLCSTP